MKRQNQFYILTRTSNRPEGFKRCFNSIKSQNYSKVKHIVSCDSKRDKSYLSEYDLSIITVEKKQKTSKEDKDNLTFAPYNLYCNELLQQVDEGWILFLDDDDFLIHNGVLTFLNRKLDSVNEETILVFQMRYPNGNVKPEAFFFDNKLIKKDHIGSPCVLVHSKIAKTIKWDEWKAADFRYIKKLEAAVSKIIWIEQPLIQIGNYGDWGGRNDVSTINPFLQRIKRNPFLWHIIPKKHIKIFGLKIFYFGELKERIPRLLKRIM